MCIRAHRGYSALEYIGTENFHDGNLHYPCGESEFPPWCIYTTLTGKRSCLLRSTAGVVHLHAALVVFKQRALSEACAAMIPDCRLAYVRIYLAPWLRSLGPGPHSNPRSASSSRKTGRSGSIQEIIVWEIAQEIIVSNIKQLARQIIQSLHCTACSIPVLAPIRTQQGAPEITEIVHLR